MHYDIKVVDELSGTTAVQRATNFRWLSLQGEPTKIEATKLQTDLIRQHRIANQKQPMSAEFAYAMLCLALVKMIWLETAQQRKGSNLSEAEFTKIQAIRIDRVKSKKKTKGSPKKELIRIRYFELIRKLREENLSWREISDYIATHHKTRLTHSYLRESYLELSAEIIKTGI